MAWLPPLTDHRRTEPARVYGAHSIPSRVFVARDRGSAAQRFGPQLGLGVRHLRVEDALPDVAGITTDYELTAPDDPAEPAAGGQGGGGIAVAGVAWVRAQGPITGSQSTWDRIDIARDGDAVTPIIGGRFAGSVRRAEPGELVVGYAIYTEPGFALVRLALGASK